MRSLSHIKIALVVLLAAFSVAAAFCLEPGPAADLGMLLGLPLALGAVYTEAPVRGFSTDIAIGQYLRVILGSDGYLDLAGSGDAECGVTEVPVFSTGVPGLVPIGVRLTTAQGTVKMIANGAIATGSPCYAAANGKVASSGTILIGTVVDNVGAAADGDIIEVLRMGVGAIASSVGGTSAAAFTILSGGSTAKLKLDTASATGNFTLTVAVPNIAADRTVTLPAVTSTLATLAGTETLSNKTITGTSVTVTAGLTSTGATGAGIGYATGAGGAVTQITNSATGVTINKLCGQITTVALTTAAGAEERFTVTNSTVAATDTIALCSTYNGNGTPAFSVCNVTAGAFDVVITNLHASAAFNAAMVLNFAVLKAVAS